MSAPHRSWPFPNPRLPSAVASRQNVPRALPSWLPHATLVVALMFAIPVSLIPEPLLVQTNVWAANISILAEGSQ